MARVGLLPQNGRDYLKVHKALKTGKPPGRSYCIFGGGTRRSVTFLLRKIGNWLVNETDRGR